MRLTTFCTKIRAYTCNTCKYVQIRHNIRTSYVHIRTSVLRKYVQHTADRMCTYCKYVQVYACILHVYVYVCKMYVYASMGKYVHVCHNFFCQYVLGSRTLILTQKGFLYFSVFNCLRLVVDRPNHGPGVDVEQGAARARLASPVAHAQWVACVLASMHDTGNGASITSWNKGQLPQDV